MGVANLVVFLSGELLASLRKSLVTHKTTTVSFKWCGALRFGLGSRAHQSCHHTLWMREEAWAVGGVRQPQDEWIYGGGGEGGCPGSEDSQRRGEKGPTSQGQPQSSVSAQAASGSVPAPGSLRQLNPQPPNTDET